MSIWNGYCSLAEFKALMTPSGQTLSTDTTDDGVIEDMIERASRKWEDMTGRKFYPRIETRYYSLPEDDLLWLDDDLLAITTFTNGDTNTIASTEYHLLPKNAYPKYAVQLTDVTSTIWETDSDASEQYVISILGTWGYRENYSTDAWITGSTLNEGAGLNASDLTFTVTSGTLFAANQIIKVDSELMIISSMNSNDITVVKRGDNGSTAATHSNGATVYYWKHPDDITDFVLAMAYLDYKARFMPSAVEVTSYISPAGIVTNPRTLPGNTREMVGKYMRRP